MAWLGGVSGGWREQKSEEWTAVEEAETPLPFWSFSERWEPVQIIHIVQIIKFLVIGTNMQQQVSGRQNNNNNNNNNNKGQKLIAEL